MKSYRIVLNTKTCIAAGECVLASPENFHFKPDHPHVSLKEGQKLPDGIREKVIQEGDLEKSLAAARSCPVKAIKIFSVETGEELL